MVPKTLVARKIRFLVITNFITAILLLGIFFKEGYPTRIVTRFRPAKPADDKKTVSQKDLLAMNNVFIPTHVDYSKGTVGDSLKIMVIGNSIALHGAAENIGWTHQSGMAATNLDNDYVHVLLGKLACQLPHNKITFRVSNFSAFERDPKSLSQSSIDSLVSFHPNIVIFQLGENASEENLPIFQKQYISLIESFKKKEQISTICTTPFFPSVRTNNIIDSVVVATNSLLVDLSRLSLLDSENLAKNEPNYKGDRSAWKVDGIGMHPGDKGMRNIAEQLFIPINALISQSKGDNFNNKSCCKIVAN